MDTINSSRTSGPGNGPNGNVFSSEINILLLGESGVGKSTFINSFANYLKYKYFDEVEKNELIVLIPSKFHVFDRFFRKKSIEIGPSDDNENLTPGAAATQTVRTYVFNVSIDDKPYKIQLIDTPGMGDPRGISQDSKNCDYILNYVGQLSKIHAVCILLKPTNTRLDVFMNYCVVQILSRLEKSATENICFVFTNTRGQNYTPGETYISLEVLIGNIKKTNNVTLPLSYLNVFCFDNEAFRYFAAAKQNVTFRDGILEANKESWDFSSKEVYRLLSYIVHLQPHDPKKTTSINRARNMILKLAQPMADIVQLIGDNIYKLEQHTKELSMDNQTLDELKNKLYMPVVDIKTKKLDQPVTVCTSAKCSELYKVADKNKYHYKQRCHNPCYLHNVPVEIVGDPKLANCAAMNGIGMCKECGCRYNMHMHIKYETETFDSRIVDKNVATNITSKEDAQKQRQKIIKELKQKKEEMEQEHKYILQCSAYFAHFLRQNAITPINDSLKEYVQYLITREESLGPDAHQGTLSYLKNLLAEYEEEKKILDEAMHTQLDSTIANKVTAGEIENKIEKLFKLKHAGPKIEELYKYFKDGTKVEHKQTVRDVSGWFSMAKNFWNRLPPPPSMIPA
ncbi:uncharacterized protein LOC115879258 [Sitophilus oryzae]|uniref:Uncharacterized protein LOC115879258 n=1 Tax=Sitophilus oryzae TaxID=7048 RepID=A0A6J2XLS3_SITOR|nr:uncharacterized protein LOC115879258 [Sitophilus oryzae]